MAGVLVVKTFASKAGVSRVEELFVNAFISNPAFVSIVGEFVVKADISIPGVVSII